MNDNKIRNEYVKILKSAPSRGGQEAPSWVIDEARTANIKISIITLNVVDCRKLAVVEGVSSNGDAKLLFIVGIASVNMGSGDSVI